MNILAGVLLCISGILIIISIIGTIIILSEKI